MTQIISIHGLQKSYRAASGLFTAAAKPVEVLRGVDLHVRSGSVLGLIGKNGAGKSTLLQCLLGLEQADAGEVRLFGENPLRLSAENKHRIGYVAQKPEFLPWLTVAQLIQYVSGFYQRWDNELVRRLLARWELESAQRVGHLSQGQQQRLALVLAMAHRPELLVLDEPVASLDPLARRSLLQQLIENNLDDGQTVIFSTHITSDLERVAADVALLKDGVMAYQGELDSWKDATLQLRLQARDAGHLQQAVESLQTVNGVKVLRQQLRENAATLTVAHCSESALAHLRQQRVEVEQQSLNLEDIFLEYHA